MPNKHGNGQRERQSGTNLTSPPRVVTAGLGFTVYRRNVGTVVCLSAVLLAGACADETTYPGFGARFLGGGRFGGSNPVVTPDGATVLFSSPRKQGVGDLCIMPIDGTETLVVSAGPYYEGQADISPDGKLIAFVAEKDGVPHVFLMNRDGSGQRRLTGSPLPEDSPLFSPDGKTVAFVRRLGASPDDLSNHEIYIADVDGQSETRVTSNDVLDSPIGFGRDGDKIYYLSGTLRYNLRCRHLGPDEMDKLVLPLGLKGGGAAISRDEQTIFFIDDRNQPFAYEVFSCAIDGTSVRQWTNFEGYIGSLRLGRDEDETITFVLEPKRDGLGQIYTFTRREGTLRAIGSNLVDGTR